MLTRRQVLAVMPRAPTFPVLTDAGLSDPVLLVERQLVEAWAACYRLDDAPAAAPTLSARRRAEAALEAAERRRTALEHRFSALPVQSLAAVGARARRLLSAARLGPSGREEADALAILAFVARATGTSTLHPLDPGAD